MDEWTDRRLDDFAAEVRRSLERLERRTEDMTDVPGKLEELAADTRDCRTGVGEIRAAFAARAEERSRERIAGLELREREQQAAKLEKKKDRRWQITTLLAATALILTGVGILLSVLT